MLKFLINSSLIFLFLFATTLQYNGALVRGEDMTEDEIADPDTEGNPPDEVVDEGNPPEETDQDETPDAAEDDDSTVETSEDEASDGTETTTTGQDSTSDDEEEKPSGIGPSPDAETTVLFPDYTDKQLPAGKPIRVLVGVSNRGEKDFIIDSLDASFRYPQDYSYHIQNFTATYYKSVIAAGQEASFQYQFYPHESYGGRPFGLTVMMLYKDNEGAEFAAGVFNETVTFKELDDAFDGEQFFMYVFLAAIALLIVFGINYKFSSSKGSKHSQPKSEEFEQGTQNGDIDYDWLPKETISDFNKSPRRSPRQRRNQQNRAGGAGSGAESE